VVTFFVKNIVMFLSSVLFLSILSSSSQESVSSCIVAFFGHFPVTVTFFDGSADISIILEGSFGFVGTLRTMVMVPTIHPPGLVQLPVCLSSVKSCP